jgi:predicted ATPase
MRIRNIRINHWRHFENIELNIDENSGLVCIVGANGTGKSQLLELIAACANRLGLSSGFDTPRGDPFNDPHNFSLQFHLAKGVSNMVDEGLAGNTVFPQWDRTLTLTSCSEPNNRDLKILAGGIVDTLASYGFAANVIEALARSEEVYFLSLDANRAYPKKNLASHEAAQAYEIEWSEPQYTRGRSFMSSGTLYDEWMKYFLAQENQAGTRLVQEFRRAKQANTEEPIFVDHFENYKQSLQKVLPHLVFSGVDPKKRTLLFDTTGLELKFDDLSGGEREIAFLIGQIDRFRLREGLFLIDEPELHLNSDLIRTWVTYLNSTVNSGQIWLATHSLEAVEAAGQQATFVLERNEETRKVDSIARLDSRPVLSALSRSVGSPAFSISQLTFVLIEGEERVGERNRFQKLVGTSQKIRFMEGGSCEEVLRKLEVIKGLAREAEAGIRIGGIIDRDFRTDAEVTKLQAEHGVFVLPVHEVENFFLHPETIRILLTQNGNETDPIQLIQNVADARAGSWIFQKAMSTANAGSLPAIASRAKERAKTCSWEDIEQDRKNVFQSIASLAGYEQDAQQKLINLLNVSADSYGRKRLETSFWKQCEGKQVLSGLVLQIGLNLDVIIQAIFAIWMREESILPEELQALRDYVTAL